MGQSPSDLGKPLFPGRVALRWGVPGEASLPHVFSCFCCAIPMDSRLGMVWHLEVYLFFFKDLLNVLVFFKFGVHLYRQVMCKSDFCGVQAPSLRNYQ